MNIIQLNILGLESPLMNILKGKMVLSRYLKLMKDLKDGVSLLINNKING